MQKAKAEQRSVSPLRGRRLNKTKPRSRITLTRVKEKVELEDIFKKQMRLLKREHNLEPHKNIFEDMLQRYANIDTKTILPNFLCVPQPAIMQRLVI